MRVIFVIILFLSSLVCHTSCNKDNDPEVLNLPTDYVKSTVEYKTISGVDPNLLSLDIYHFGQTAAEKPIIIYVHGGGWRIGDKKNSMGNKKSLFSSLGYLLISVNYRPPLLKRIRPQ
jgi:arylformamidase